VQRLRLGAPFLLAAVLAALAFSSLPRYGVNWDEALGDFFFGEQTLATFTGFEARPLFDDSPFRRYAWEYPPVAATLGAASSRTLTALGLTDPFDGFHALNILLAAVLLIVIFRFAERAFDFALAVAAVLFLFTMPRVVAELMVNIKDFPEMALFALTLFAWFAAWRRGSFAGVVASGALWGLALGTKANALFLPPIALIVLLAARRDDRRRMLLASCAALLLGLVVAYAAWPFLWADPITRIGYHLRYITERARMSPQSVRSSPLLMIALTTPLSLLAAFVAGVPPLFAGMRKRSEPHLLVGAWLTVVALRVCIPGSVNFDVVRHFLEIFPPLAITAALGVSWLTARRELQAALITVVAAISFSTIVQFHPFETMYWNRLAGGPAGARERHIPQSGDYWAVSYRTGMEWLNAHAEKGSAVVVPIAEHTVQMTAPLRLRSDLQVPRYAPPAAPTRDIRRLQFAMAVAQTRAVYVMFVPRDDWANETTEYCHYLKPVAQWERGGAPVLVIYRLGVK
jgi:4-amino-4-deoxy-L-arabinose transferase-like glycosyltransferase